MANLGTEAEKEEKAIDCQNKDIIRTIFEKCKYESTHGLQIPLELYRERVLFYTNASEHLLDEITNEEKLSFETDLCDRVVINDALRKLYLQQNTFSFTELYEIVKDKMMKKMPDVNHFCRVLKQLGYKPVNTLNYGPILVEDPKLTFDRFRYLNKITKYRDASKLIYYIDERIIDFDRTFKKPWTENKDKLQVEGYVFYHIVSKSGFEKGLFCNQANEEDFHKWVSDILLSFIKPSSVIIMDNNPLHGKKVCKPITRHHSKADMINWLQRNNIPCSPDMHKAELYDLIARCPIRDNQYQLDLIFKSHGHEVLRLPQNYHDLSLTELLWEHIRSGAYDFEETETLFKLKSKVYNAITSLRQDKWLEFETIIKNTEKDMLAVNEVIERALDSYEVDPKDIN